MAESVRVDVKLFGAFRGFTDEGEVQLLLPKGATVSDVKTALAELWDARTLVDQSAIASMMAEEERILNLEDPVGEGTRLAVLPPVCGG